MPRFNPYKRSLKTPQTLSGAGAISLTTELTLVTSTGAGQALTLADGTGKVSSTFRKRIAHVVDGGSVVLTAGANLHLAHSIASITLANKGDWIELQWIQSLTAWALVGCGGTGTNGVALT